MQLYLFKWMKFNHICICDTRSLTKDTPEYPTQESDEEQMEEVGDDGDAGNGNGDAKDPRAGGVDVTIPQLQVDCAALAEALFEAGGEKGVGHAQRAALYRLTKQFKSLAEGRSGFDFELSNLQPFFISGFNCTFHLKRF